MGEIGLPHKLEGTFYTMTRFFASILIVVFPVLFRELAVYRF